MSSTAISPDAVSTSSSLSSPSNTTNGTSSSQFESVTIWKIRAITAEIEAETIYDRAAIARNELVHRIAELQHENLLLTRALQLADVHACATAMSTSVSSSDDLAKLQSEVARMKAERDEAIAERVYSSKHLPVIASPAPSDVLDEHAALSQALATADDMATCLRTAQQREAQLRADLAEAKQQLREHARTIGFLQTRVEELTKGKASVQQAANAASPPSAGTWHNMLQSMSRIFAHSPSGTTPARAVSSEQRKQLMRHRRHRSGAGSGSFSSDLGMPGSPMVSRTALQFNSALHTPVGPGLPPLPDSEDLPRSGRTPVGSPALRRLELPATPSVREVDSTPGST